MGRLDGRVGAPSQRLGSDKGSSKGEGDGPGWWREAAVRAVKVEEEGVSQQP